MSAKPSELPAAADDEALAELERAWNERGPAAIRTIAKLEPARYLALIARLIGDDD